MSAENAVLPTAANFESVMAERFAAEPTTDAPELDSSLGAEQTEQTEQTEQPEQTEQTEQPEQPEQSQLLAAAKESGRVTSELMQEIGDLKVEVKLAGGMSEVPIKELANGYMRQAHFQRSMEKANAAQAKADQIFEIERARTNSWQRDPSQLYNGLLAMGCEQTLERVFEYLVQERHAYLTATPEQRQYIDRNKALQKQQAQMQQRMAELERQTQLAQQQAPAQMDEATQTAYRYIEQNMDRELSVAFKAANVGKVTPYALQLFEQELQGYAKMGNTVEEAVRNAATAVADRFVEIKQTANANANDGTPPPKPKPVGAPVQRSADGRFVAQSNAKSNGKPPPTAAEFAKRFGL